MTLSKSLWTTVLCALLLAVVGQASARFLSPDPVPADPNTGKNFNRYSYANNNPYTFVDPDGRQSVLACANPANAAACAAAGIGTRVTAKQAANAAVHAGGAAAVITIVANEAANQAGSKNGPEVPGNLVGEQDGKGGAQGGRHNSGPLAPENGGTGDPAKDFETLTGGKSAPAPEGSRYPAGTQVGENGIAIRPGTEKAGPRIDIPAQGDKPHETLHYPKDR